MFSKNNNLYGLAIPAPISRQPEGVFQEELDWKKEEQYYKEEEKIGPETRGILCGRNTISFSIHFYLYFLPFHVSHSPVILI
jgi:hypothetical protein